MRQPCYPAEFLGTLLLVFAGCGSMVANANYGGALGHVGVCISWGLIVTAMIYTIGGVSGAHINPAVTLAFAASGRFPWRRVLPYVLAQCLGAIAGAALIWACFGWHDTLGGTLPYAAHTTALVRAGLTEIMLSFLLMFVIFGVSTGAMEVGHMAGLAVGSTVALCALFGGPVSMASMNPARSLGPALVSGHLQDLWLYLLCPVLGMLLAVPTTRLLTPCDCD